MATQTTSYTTKEIVERGQAIYEQQIRGEVEAGHHGEFLVVDIETGDYEMDREAIPASRRLKARRPNAVPYLVRIGYPTAYKVGAHVLVQRS